MIKILKHSSSHLIASGRAVGEILIFFKGFGIGSFTMLQRVHWQHKLDLVLELYKTTEKTLKARKAWTDVLQTLRDHRYQPILLYLAKLSITINGKSKLFNDEVKFKQYFFTSHAIHNVLDGKLETREVCGNILFVINIA